MKLTKMEEDLRIHQKLDDEPNDVGGLSADQLKAKFDEAGNTIKDYINDSLIPQVLSEGITEAQREQNEAEREQNEEERQSAEDIRSMNELQRNRNDDAREDAETARQTAETARQTAESARVRAEDGRVRAEDGRVFGESERETAETARETAEAVRASAESTRVAAESARETAETARETAEAARESAEAGRESAETARVQAEAEREDAQTAFFQGVSASAELLPQGSEATASAAAQDGSFHVSFGIPAGGPAGKSAYQYAVDGGYTGTEEEFQALMGTGPWLGIDTVDAVNVTLEPSKPGISGSVVSYSNATAIDSAPIFLNKIVMKNEKIEGVATPERGYDAANKHYVDSALSAQKVVAQKITVSPKNVSVSTETSSSTGVKKYAGIYLNQFTVVLCFPDESSAEMAAQCKIKYEIDGWYLEFRGSATPTADLTYNLLAFP